MDPKPPKLLSWFKWRPSGKTESKKGPKDPLGLTPISTPSAPVVDIIFIHGLGGSSLRSWSWNHETRNLWPQWLADEPQLTSARIWTYGFAGGIDGEATKMSIIDFAKELLFKLKNEPAHGGVPIGLLPIFLVTHSMGGLVAKKAFMSGISNDEYASIMARVQAMVFFSTPHWGGKGAENLSRLLRAVGMSKRYVKELMANSALLHSINDDFVHVCSGLQLFSFYETEKTLTPAGYNIIVDKASGVLHIRNETSSPMAADHHTVCKFETKEDPRFKDVQNLLIRLLQASSHIKSPGPEATVDSLAYLSRNLGIVPNTVDEAMDRLLSTAKPGTCQWIEQRDWFSTWLRGHREGPRLLWISGAPGAGKSVLAAYIARLVRDARGRDSCQYHAFDFLDKPKRSASYLLRSFAFQIAGSQPSLRESLHHIIENSSVTFLTTNTTALWENVFSGVLLEITTSAPLYWVIDGLDETEDEAIPQIFHCLKSLFPNSNLRVLIMSRKVTDISMHVAQLDPATITTYHISEQDTIDDIRSYIEGVIPAIVPEDIPSRQNTVMKILERASGSFLWAALATRNLKESWYSQEAIDQALDKLPSEMATQYDRMMERIQEYPDEKKKLAIALLSWVTFAFRPLQLNELQQALDINFPGITSPKDTIKAICGDFIRIQGDKLLLVHETARQYFMTGGPQAPESLKPGNAHEYMARTCLDYLTTFKERQWKLILKMEELRRSQTPSASYTTGGGLREIWPFLHYAATAWPFHIGHANSSSDTTLSRTTSFLVHEGLPWINAVALSGSLSPFLHASQSLEKCLAKLIRSPLNVSPVYLEIVGTDYIELLGQWATDLAKLVGRFGSHLLEQPSCIHTVIPQFAPVRSRLAHGCDRGEFCVKGVFTVDWDDSHARLSMGPGCYGIKLIATAEVFAALVPGIQGLVVWHAETCEEIRRIIHGEYVLQCAVNRRGDLVCTAGRDTIKIWELSTGREVQSFKKHSEERVLAVAIGLKMTTSWWATKITSWSARTGEHRLCGLRVVSFNPDSTRLVVGNARCGVLLWDLTTKTRIAKCVLKAELTNSGKAAFLQPECVQWHPMSGSIYILYHNATLLDWNPIFDEKHEYRLIGAKGMACSPCGKYLVTHASDGSVKIHRLSDYSQEQRPSELRLLHHLEQPRSVRDIAFSADGRRLYDLRDTSCNAWDPEVLAIPSALGDRIGKTFLDNRMLYDRSDSSPVLEPITTIAWAPKEVAFCSGNDVGAIHIHETRTGNAIRSVGGHTSGMAILKLAWSSTGKWIASADDSGRVLVRKVHLPTDSDQPIRIYKPSGFRVIDNGVDQLLFSPDDRFLLVSTSSDVRVWDMQEKGICHVQKYTSAQPRKWIEHPLDPSHVLCIDAREILNFAWKHFSSPTPADGVRFTLTSHSRAVVLGKGKGPVARHVEDTALEAYDVTSITWIGGNQSIVLEMIPRTGHEWDCQKHRRIDLIPTKAVSAEALQNNLTLESVPPDLSREILKIVGSCLNRLVFFNRQYWLCTWEFGAVVQNYKRHFFLPRHWVSPETLELCVLSEQGTLLCPKGGKVAVITDGLKL